MIDGTEEKPKSVEALEKFIAETLKLDKDTKVSVHLWVDGDVGPRVSEISLTNDKPSGNTIYSSYSWMRSDVQCGSIILAAEDFLLTFDEKPHRPDGWQTDIDEHGDAKFRLEWAMKSEEMQPGVAKKEEGE